MTKSNHTTKKRQSLKNVSIALISETSPFLTELQQCSGNGSTNGRVSTNSQNSHFMLEKNGPTDIDISENERLSNFTSHKKNQSNFTGDGKTKSDLYSSIPSRIHTRSFYDQEKHSHTTSHHNLSDAYPFDHHIPSSSQGLLSSDLDPVNHDDRSEIYNSSSANRGLLSQAGNDAGGNSNSTHTKGLRQFSLRVCKKVEEKSVTSYNEVADELVHDLGYEIGRGDQKNIRRRVYDALNVLMAMDIIKKDKKEIVWLGLPNDLIQDLEICQKEKSMIQNRIAQKKKNLQEFIMRQTALKHLVQRNKVFEEQCIQQAKSSGLPISSVLLPSPQDILHLPFLLINAPRECRINCEMLEDRSHYYFQFDTPFLIHEDIEILRLMGLCQSSSNTSTASPSGGGNTNNTSLLTNTNVNGNTDHSWPSYDAILNMDHLGTFDPHSNNSTTFSNQSNFPSHKSFSNNMSVVENSNSNLIHSHSNTKSVSGQHEYPTIDNLDFNALPDLDPLLTFFQDEPQSQSTQSLIPQPSSSNDIPMMGFSSTRIKDSSDMAYPVTTNLLHHDRSCPSPVSNVQNASSPTFTMANGWTSSSYSHMNKNFDSHSHYHLEDDSTDIGLENLPKRQKTSNQVPSTYSKYDYSKSSPMKPLTCSLRSMDSPHFSEKMEQPSYFEEISHNSSSASSPVYFHSNRIVENVPSPSLLASKQRNLRRKLGFS